MLLDTYAWIEILIDSRKGRQALKLLENSRPATAVPSLSEIAVWALRNGMDPETIVEKVSSESTVLDFTPKVAELAGRLHFKYRQKGAAWGLVDAMIYATALANGEQLLTGDSDFAKIPGCTVI